MGGGDKETVREEVREHETAQAIDRERGVGEVGGERESAQGSERERERHS